MVREQQRLVALRFFQSLLRGRGHAVDWLLQNQLPVSCSFCSLQPALRMLCTGPGARLALIGRCSVHACTHIHRGTSAPFLLFPDYQPSHLQPRVASPETTTGSSSGNFSLCAQSRHADLVCTVLSMCCQAALGPPFCPLQLLSTPHAPGLGSYTPVRHDFSQ